MAQFETALNTIAARRLAAEIESHGHTVVAVSERCIDVKEIGFNVIDGSMYEIDVQIPASREAVGAWLGY